jgi:WD40 repeat protein
VAFSPDGQFIAQHLGAGGGYLSLWRISDRTLLFRSENLSLGVAFSPDGRYLAHAELDPSGVNRVVVRSADGNDLIRVLEGPENTSQLGKVIFSPDSTRLVAVDNYLSAKILIWQVADGRYQQIRDIPCP